jgi:hypothetical protein
MMLILRRFGALIGGSSQDVVDWQAEGRHPSGSEGQ